MTVEFIYQGKASGGVASTLLRSGMDMNILRPFVGEDGNSYVNKMVNGKLKAVMINNVSVMRRDNWLRVDEAVVKAAKPVLRAVGDLRAAGLVKNINGMATPVLAYEMIGDITKATMSMDGLREGEKDVPNLDIAYLPIPILHKDVSFSARQLAIAGQGNNPFDLDTDTLEMAARRVAEEAEELLIGTLGSYSFGGGTIYGYTNYPGRATKTMTLPTAAGWSPEVFVDETLDMIQSLKDKFRPGPYMMYVSSNWNKALNSDYSSTYNGDTLRSRMQKVDDITAVRQLDYLTGYQVLLVQMTSDVIRMINGMDIRTVQWPEKGGMEICFKVMAILVPQIRTDIRSNAGIAHGVAA